MVPLHVCVCLREKRINNSHQSSTSCLSQQLVCRRAVRIINYTHTHTRTHGHTQAHTLHHYCQQLPSRPCEYPNNIIITSILQQCAPFQSPWPFAPQGTKRNTTSLPGLIPHNRTIGPSTPPCSSHYWADLWPRGTCQREVGASACQWTVARGVREVLGNEWEVCVNVCLRVEERACVKIFFGAFVCVSTVDVGLYFCACVCICTVCQCRRAQTRVFVREIQLI